MNVLDLYIYNEIGANGLNADYVQNEIKEAGDVDQINVHMSSPGGGVYDGWTIGNIIAQHPAKSVCLIEGYCGSIATYVALKCDEVFMSPTANFMIHNASIEPPSSTKEGLTKFIQQLSKIDGDLMAVYKNKTNLPEERIVQMMTDETTMTSKEAVSMGFVDGYIENIKAVAKFDLENKMAEEAKTNPIDADVKEKVGVINKLFNDLRNVFGEPAPAQEQDDEEKPKDMALTLEDGTKLFVVTEDGEVEGKEVFIANEDGSPTETPAPDGTHTLSDGRSITVENGVITSVQEASSEDDGMSEEEMKAKIAALEAQVAEANAATEKAKAEAETVKAEAEKTITDLKAKQDDTTSIVTQLAEEVKNLSSMTTGKPFSVDKPLTQPKAKSVQTTPSNEGGLDTLLNKIKQKWQ